MSHIYIPGTAREHYAILFAIAGSIALGAGLVGAWLGAYFGARRALREAARTGAGLAQGDPMVAEQLARLGQALDSVAVEVERISEGQRFSARLLAERGEPARTRPMGSNTPH